MVCPICVVDGAVIASCKIFGIPDTITMFLLGILTMSISLIGNRFLKTAGYEFPFQLLIIVVVLSAATLYGGYLWGMI